ncbi:glycosyltransferase [Thalassoroseus pseudoceratinae]|uniref:glycosyltransferase n=1 Tax=Thalassoroseus pseudoceratinae TaxID=2713176 RepID=UPI001F0E22FD|nr:glycosyltransferase [Thalassoroseus pseudoceratinae]
MSTTSLPLLVFADDWGRHPSSCQHLVRRLLPRQRVGWINTIGMRPPRLDMATVRRGGEKIRQWLVRSASDDDAQPNSTAKQNCPENLDVLNPRMWPRFRRGWERHLNRRLLSPPLQRWIETVGGSAIGVTTLPITADLMKTLPVDRWVYYCVDDFSVWPGLDGATMLHMERQVIEQADILIAAGRNLRDRLATLRPDKEVHLLTHGVDLEFWQKATPPDVPLEFPSPHVLFWGLIDQRLDLDFLRQLATDLAQGSILLAGREQNPHPDLFDIPRVHRLGPLPLESLPEWAAIADVLVMPYADLPVTRAMQPLKMLEYLATGRPAVVRDLPACQDWADSADLATTPEEFSQKVRQRIVEDLPFDQAAARRARLPQESWDAKAEQFYQLLTADRRT